MDYMRDPSTANCRIYIGQLPGNCRKEVEDYFKQFGNVTGVILNRGFGFVQFDNPDSALDAIQTGNGAQFMGNKISVSQAVAHGPEMDNNRGRGRGGMMRGRGRGGMMNMRGGGPQNQGNGNNWNADRERSPLDEHRGFRDGGGGGPMNMNFGGPMRNQGKFK